MNNQFQLQVKDEDSRSNISEKCPLSRSLNTYHINYIKKCVLPKQLYKKQIKKDNTMGEAFLIKPRHYLKKDYPDSEDEDIFDL